MQALNWWYFRPALYDNRDRNDTDQKIECKQFVTVFIFYKRHWKVVGHFFNKPIILSLDRTKIGK